MYLVISSLRAFCLERAFLLQYMAGALSPSSGRVLSTSQHISVVPTDLHFPNTLSIESIMDDNSANAPSVPRPPEITLVVSPAQDKEAVLERLREREDVIQYAGFCFDINSERPVNRPEANGDIVLDIVMFCRRKPALHFMHTPSLSPKVRQTRDTISAIYGVSDLMMGKDYPAEASR